MTGPSELTNSELRVELLEAFAMWKDRTETTANRQAAKARWDALSAEINAREGAAFGKRQQRLLRGF